MRALTWVSGRQHHPQSNIDKMSRGTPLTDEDRWDWLTALREEALRQLASGHAGVVVTCSALKRKYRDVIRVAPYFSHNVRIHFIYLHASEEVLMQRVCARRGHFFNKDMVHSQLNILEPPDPMETDVIQIDVGRNLEEVQAEAVAKIAEAVEGDD